MSPHMYVLCFLYFHGDILSMTNSQLVSFAVCKSCLVKHLEENNTCPRCGNVIHQSHPLQYISFDRTMQDIVYKLVPNLQEGISPYNRDNQSLSSKKTLLLQFSCLLFYRFARFTDEMKREREFYKSRNLPNPKDLPQNNEDDAFDRLNESHVESDFHRQDEQVNVCLECTSTNLNALKRRFLRCSSQATITHLKKFVAKKVLNGIDKYKEVSWNINVDKVVKIGNFTTLLLLLHF